MRKKTIDDARRLANKRGWRVLSNKYINNSINIEWMCDNGHIFLMSYSNAQSGRNCKYCKKSQKTGRKVKNLLGFKSHKLTVVEFVGVIKKNAYWKCQCECGNFTNIRASHIQNKIKSCGKCFASVHDITGNKINMLIVLGFDGKKGDNYYWLCKCECGNKIIVNRAVLSREDIVSCGCHRIKDISNERYGKLVAKSIAHRGTDGIYWLCECDCGNEKAISGHSLRRGTTKSCGCAKHIKQNLVSEIISNILNEECISDCRQFEWLVNPKTNCRLEIDIYFPNIRLAIEYDGEFHFRDIMGKEKLSKQKQRDRIKNKLIKKHIKNGAAEIENFIRFSCKDEITEDYIVKKLKEHSIV